MKKMIAAAVCFSFLWNVMAQTLDFKNYPTYNGKDLGLTYSPQTSFFRIWSPPAQQVQLFLYDEGINSKPIATHALQKDIDGTWTLLLKGDYLGKFYTFQVMIDGKWMDEVPDPYAKAVGVNGKRAMVVDLTKTNPTGWEKDKSPSFQQKTDAIIYELHVRDASMHTNSGIQHKGKFLGLTEKGTKNSHGEATGLDHLKQLGVTHIHLLPSYDFYSVDETKLNQPQYNWGYDPLNYNVPEGSYSTNPYDGNVRIKEFKQLIKTLHENGMRVIMDVVYNHTMLTENSYFNQLVPGYYYRQTADGKFSNATACGNETASERTMMQKFMVESVLYWVKEYHIDGFRFDLMGVHDIETMNIISKKLHELRPDILLYGEGWTAGSSPLPDEQRALKKNAPQLYNIAVFSDDIRDAIKGSVFEHTDNGFVSGKKTVTESIKFGIVAATQHPQINYNQVNYSKAPYANHPTQTITYAECHDNHVLWDKLALSAPNATEEDRVAMHKLAYGIVLTAQGIPFIHAGGEFLRTKKGVENSFDSPDTINAIDWDLKHTNQSVFAYLQQLIQLRKAHPAFRMTHTKEVAQHLHFIDGLPDGVIAYEIDGAAVKDSWKKIMVIVHANNNTTSLNLSKGKWNTAVLNGIFNKPKFVENSIEVSGIGLTVLYQ